MLDRELEDVIIAVEGGTYDDDDLDRWLRRRGMSEDEFMDAMDEFHAKGGA